MIERTVLDFQIVNLHEKKLHAVLTWYSRKYVASGPRSGLHKIIVRRFFLIYSISSCCFQDSAFSFYI